MSNESAENNQNQLSNDGMFNIEKMYVKNISLESPRAPKIFFDNIQPDIEFKFNLNSSLIEESYYENVISTSVIARVEKEVIFICEVSQGGIFKLENVNAQMTDVLLNVTCPSILFPYLREVVSETIVRAGFPPIYLAPINFDAMYQEQLSQTVKA